MITLYPILPGTVLNTTLVNPTVANPIVVKYTPSNTTVAQPTMVTIPFLVPTS